MNNWKQHFPSLMPFVGILALALLFFGSGCSLGNNNDGIVVMRDTSERVLDLLKLDPIYGATEEKEILVCEPTTYNWLDCRDSSYHTGDGYAASHATIPVQGPRIKPAKLLGVADDEEVVVRRRQTSKQAEVTDAFYGNDPGPAESESVPVDSQLEFPWWLLWILLALAALVGLYRWLTSPRRTSTAPGYAVTDAHVVAARHAAEQGRVPVPVLVIENEPQGTESVTTDEVVTIVVRGGGPNVLTEDIFLNGTIKVNRTFRNPNAPAATPAPVPPASAAPPAQG